MKSKRPIALLCSICIAALIMLGCATPPFRQDLKVQGALPLIQPDSFEKIDLARELDPQSPALIEGLYLTDEELAKNREALRKAFEKFYKTPKDELKLLRNRIQERIIAASNQRCGEYKKFLKQLDAGTNFFLGALTTAVAGAGAIVTGPATAVRALSGSAGIVSGIRAEFNETYFQNKTIQVLTDGIEAKRKELYEKILEARGTTQEAAQGATRRTTQGTKEIEDYTVEAAIKDAITYHDACALIAGLEHAALSVERASNPGVEAAKKVLDQLPSLNRALRSAVSPEGSGTQTPPSSTAPTMPAPAPGAPAPAIPNPSAPSIPAQPPGP